MKYQRTVTKWDQRRENVISRLEFELDGIKAGLEKNSTAELKERMKRVTARLVEARSNLGRGETDYRLAKYDSKISAEIKEKVGI